MDRLPPVLQLSIGVVVERRRANNPWTDYVWAPVDVLPGPVDAAAWTLLSSDEGRTTFFGGNIEITLYRTETNNYRENLMSARPSIWVALQPSEGDWPYSLAAATADPAEGESFTQTGESLVDAVDMPGALRELVAKFIETYPVRQMSYKRQRDQPQALSGSSDKAEGH